MERLSDTAIDIINDLHTERLEYTSEYIPLIDSANKLAEYEDLEGQGLFLRLPCKVGDTVYIITKVFNGKEVIGAIGRRKIDSIGGNALNPIYVISKEPYELRFCPSEFGVRVFKTKEEAEAKLREMEVGE